jgi:hypothetical protein
VFRTFDEKKTVASAGVRPFLNTMAAMAWLGGNQDDPKMLCLVSSFDS